LEKLHIHDIIYQSFIRDEKYINLFHAHNTH